MSLLILFYVLIIALVVAGIIAASVVYLNRRRGKEPAGQPPIAPPLSEDRQPPMPR
jgi:heme/copper-type cytochrome/quinol oxidase subunit 2